MTGLRNYLHENQAVGYGISLVVAVLAGYFLITRILADPYAGPSKAYYYNLANEEIVVLSSASVPPVDMGSNEQAVLAHMYGCGSCGDESAMQVAYLEKRSDDAKALLEKYPDTQSVPQGEIGPLMRPDYQLVASPEGARDGQWLPAGTSGLVMNLNGNCEDGQPKVVCVP
ncbi:MAG: hypothetical protein AAGH99_10485 [Planctomycetota bacterium]